MFLEDKERGKKYFINAELGRGSYGKCFLSTDTDTRVRIACKQVKSIGEFQSEASIHSKLSHKHIVKFISSFVSDGMGYIVMELCTKGNLNGLLKARTFLSNPEVKCIIKQVISGVDYLHNNLIVHRDIKLLNLLISENMDIKIADFGLAWQLKSIDEKRESFCGTNNYVAPEVIEGIGYSFAADIWAVGCVFYTLLVGKEPFHGETQEETLRNISRISFAKSKLSTLGCSFLKTVFVLNPEERPKATSILHHPYFATGSNIDALPMTVFTGPPIMHKQHKTAAKKRQPLTDRTNLGQNKKEDMAEAKYVGGGGKENVCNYTWALRPRKQNNIVEDFREKLQDKVIRRERKFEGKKEKVGDKGIVGTDYTKKLRPRKQQPAEKDQADEYLFEVLQDPEISSGEETKYEIVSHAEERRLLLAAEKLLKMEDIHDFKEMLSSKTSFLCVSRWAEMQLGILAYTLSDGSLGINMGNDKDHFFRYPGGKMKYFQNDNTWSFVKDKIPRGMERFVAWTDETRGLLLNLKKTAPSTCFKGPVILPVWKYFKDPAAPEKPTTVFLLTNGACQVNLANHEKLILNVNEDLLAMWVNQETLILSLQKVEKGGLPYGFREKLMFVQRFLREVIPYNLQQ